MTFCCALFRSVSAGMLGVIVEVELDIIRDVVVKSNVQLIDQGDFIAVLRNATINDSSVDEVNFFWYPALKKMIRCSIDVSGLFFKKHFVCLFGYIYLYCLLFSLCFTWQMHFSFPEGGTRQRNLSPLFPKPSTMDSRDR